MKKIFISAAQVLVAVSLFVTPISLLAAEGDFQLQGNFQNLIDSSSYPGYFGNSGGSGYNPYSQAPSSCTAIRDIRSLACNVQDFINRYLIPLGFSVALLYFLYNCYEYIKEPKPEKAYRIAWGVVGLAVMVSVWGLVNFVTSTFNLDNSPLRIQDIQIR